MKNIFKLYIFSLIFFFASINSSSAISKNPECYKSSDFGIGIEGFELNNDGKYLIKMPSKTFFTKYGKRLRLCQYKKMSDIELPVYTTIDIGNERGQILNGYKEGIWTEYYNGTEIKKSTGNYINNLKDGKWVEFDNLGLVTNEVTYVMGEIVTNNEIKPKNNKVLINDLDVIKEPKSDTPDIDLSFENLLQINGIYFDPIKNIPITIDYKSGNYLGKITNGYINEYPDTWTKLDENGNIEYIGYFNKNNRDGDWIFYQNNSIYEQGSYSDGLKTDFWMKYYPNGNVLSRGKYSNDKQDGPWVYFNKDGSVLETGAYNNGIKTGPWVNLVTGTTINY